MSLSSFRSSVSAIGTALTKIAFGELIIRAVRVAFVTKLEEMVDKDFVDISWSQRRAFAVSSFCEAMSRGKSKMEAYGVASMAARVHPSTARSYIADYLKNEGFLWPC